MEPPAEKAPHFLKIGKKKACRGVQTRELKMKGKDVETGGLLNNKSLPLYVSPHPNQAEVAVGIFNQPTNCRLYCGMYIHQSCQTTTARKSPSYWAWLKELNHFKLIFPRMPDKQ